MLLGSSSKGLEEPYKELRSNQDLSEGTKKMNSEVEMVIIYDHMIPDSEVEWLQGCAIGRFRDGMNVKKAQDLIEPEDISCQISSSVESVKIQREVAAWISLEEVPLHLWNEQFFRSLRDKWGKFIKKDSATASKSLLDTARILVSVQSKLNIPPPISMGSKGMTRRILGTLGGVGRCDLLQDGHFTYHRSRIAYGSSWYCGLYQETYRGQVQQEVVGFERSKLNVGGRVVLIKSVLSSLPVYYMSLFEIPVTVKKILEKIQRKFLWGGSIETRTHWKLLELEKMETEIRQEHTNYRTRLSLQRWDLLDGNAAASSEHQPQPSV
ncbi:hypothetical protein DITRI_Ditri10aG0178800 [Diplodiscus trichospermus]